MRPRAAILAHDDRVACGGVEVLGLYYISAQLGAVVGTHGKELLVGKARDGAVGICLIVFKDADLFAVGPAQAADGRGGDIAVGQHNGGASGRKDGVGRAVVLAQRLYYALARQAINGAVFGRGCCSTEISVAGCVAAVVVYGIGTVYADACKFGSGVGIFIKTCITLARRGYCKRIRAVVQLLVCHRLYPCLGLVRYIPSAPRSTWG